ncbi:MAG: amidohydrolase family protein [Acidobacteriota bacterium]
MQYRLENLWVPCSSGLEEGSLVVSGHRLASSSSSRSPCFDLEGAVVLPAFINGHDHLDLAGAPRTGRPGGYRNARYWYEDVQEAKAEPAFKAWLDLPLSLRRSLGAFVNLFNGCLTVSHHNPSYWWHFRRRLPVEVVGRYGWIHSLALEPDPPRALRRCPGGAPFVLHFAEGVDEDARSELERLTLLRMLTERTVLVHGVGLAPESMPKLAAAGTSLIWCPSSNLFLFGRTLAARAALAAGVPLAVGSDSTLSGEGGFLKELPYVRRLSGLAGVALLRQITEVPARIFRLSDRGAIREGLRADLLILHHSVKHEEFCPSRLTPRSIALVVRGGRPILADFQFERIFRELEIPAVKIRLGNVVRLLDHRYSRRFHKIVARGLCPATPLSYHDPSHTRPRARHS